MLKGRGYVVSCANKAAKSKSSYGGTCSIVIYLICSGQASLTRKQIYVIFVEL